jgi:hypothetical protein
MGHRPRLRPWLEPPQGGREGALSQEAGYYGQAGGAEVVDALPVQPGMRGMPEAIVDTFVKTFFSAKI